MNSANDAQRKSLNHCCRIVVKIGSALLTDDGKGLDLGCMDSWVRQMSALHYQGKKIVLVSSGAIAVGMQRLQWGKRPHALHDLQAAAAVGQMGLVEAYQNRFQKQDIEAAQILLTHDDLADRERYLNARSTLRSLIHYQVIPVINENDTVATDNIRFGDNDTLAALVTNLIEADLLIILTDQGGLYEQDPRKYPKAKQVLFGHVSDRKLQAMAGKSHGKLGQGGMSSKVNAAILAARSGCTTIIADGRQPDVLLDILSGQSIGTLLMPDQPPMIARKQWLAGQLKRQGKLVLDEGAVNSLIHFGGSLLAVGVVDVAGQFSRGDLVACVDLSGREIGRGLINYNALETHKIKGQGSQMIEHILGYIDEDELIHRDNLMLLSP